MNQKEFTYKSDEMNYSYLVKELQGNKTMRLAEKELRTLIAVNDYDEYYIIVEKLVAEGFILPIASSGSNGMNPPLYKRYSISKKQRDFDNYFTEIRLLSGAFNVEGYLDNPQKYAEHRPWVQILDTFIKSDNQALSTQLSINERSFQVFGREKAIKEDKNLQAVLNFNPDIRDKLNYYMTPEPFFIHRITEIYEDINILIIENKDTWYTLKSIMKPSLNNMLGISFDILLYGEGKKISRRLDSLTEFDASFFNNNKTVYYYFGDLDYEGIGIFNDLKNVNPELNIKLFSRLYSWMLEEVTALLKSSEGKFKLPQTKAKQNRKSIELFLKEFSAKEGAVINNILEEGKYIPQEILNRESFYSRLKSEKAL